MTRRAKHWQIYDHPFYSLPLLHPTENIIYQWRIPAPSDRLIYRPCGYISLDQKKYCYEVPKECSIVPPSIRLPTLKSCILQDKPFCFDLSCPISSVAFSSWRHEDNTTCIRSRVECLHSVVRIRQKHRLLLLFSKSQFLFL